MLSRKPNSRHNLDMAIYRLAGSDAAFVRLRTILANTIIAQMMPEGAVKGGSSLKMRFGDLSTRFTNDLDTARKSDLKSFVSEFADNLSEGWNGFTGRIVRREPATPKGVPAEYIMQPYDVKLDYCGRPWCTINLEIGHNEIGDADNPEYGIAQDITNIFEELALPEPAPIPLMPLHHQIAQKLHALSTPGCSRAHDLIDLQIITILGDVDWEKTSDTCVRLFSYRNGQAWPPTIEKGEGWDSLYRSQAAGLEVIPDVDDAIVWANELIARLSEQSAEAHTKSPQEPC